jgi:hypothetical protein
VNGIKKHLKKLNYSNNLLKYEPFANLKNLREEMLYVIRKNYISNEEIVNIAFKQYKYWSNLRDEGIENIIKINTPKYPGIKFVENAICIQEIYEKYFPFYDAGNYDEYEQRVGYIHLEIDSKGGFKSEEERTNTHMFRSWIEIMPNLLNVELKDKFWITRMKYFHKHRRPTKRRIYDVEIYLREINQIDEHEDIEIIKIMKEWNTMRCINVLRVVNANITNITLFEAYIKNPNLLEYHEQILKFLEPIEVDDFPCKPSPPENPKERRLRLPKVHQIDEECIWTKDTNRILTKEALQIFFNIFNTYKLINETYNKDWEFDNLLGETKEQIWKIRETIMMINFKKKNAIGITEDNDLEIGNVYGIDDELNLESVITTLQYLKDRYYKNGNPRISVNRCLKGPVFSWIDYQRNHVKKVKRLEPNIIELDEENQYWEKRPSVGYIFKETWEEIKKKAWIRIKLNYIAEHPHLLPKFLPLIETISPQIISLVYSKATNNVRTKWKAKEQRTPNFRLRWKREVIYYNEKDHDVTKRTFLQFTYNSCYHKFSGSKPNLPVIKGYILNPKPVDRIAESKKLSSFLFQNC